MMGMELPLPAIRSQIASGIDILVHLGRLRDKSRKVLNITEIVGIENGEIQLHELFSFVEEKGEGKKVCGKLIRTGLLIHREKFYRAGFSEAELGGADGLSKLPLQQVGQS